MYTIQPKKKIKKIIGEKTKKNIKNNTRTVHYTT